MEGADRAAPGKLSRTLPRPVVRQPFGGFQFDLSATMARSVFDHISDGHLAISLRQLEVYLRSRCGESEERIAMMVADLDVNGDGMIDEAEWQKAWKAGVVSALRP